MGENLTARQKAKLEELKRLCSIWKKFTHVDWHGVHIIVEKGDVNIIWYQILYLEDDKGKKKKHFNTSFKYFPIKNLTKQINSYKDKIKLEYSIRHKTEEEKDKVREEKGIYR